MKNRYAVCKLCGVSHSSREPHKLIGGPWPSKRESASVASTAEQRTRNAQVGGSSPPRGSSARSTVAVSNVPLALAFDGIGPLTRESARSLTDGLKVALDQISKEADAVARALELAQRREAWKALGYASWNEYVGAEFEIGKRRANQLVSHERFMLALGAGSRAPAHATLPEVAEIQVGTAVPTPTERQTREIRGDPAATARVRRMVAQGKTPREAVEAVNRSADFGPRTVNAACVHLYQCVKCGAQR